MSTLIMPKATTVWLVDNTTLTFKQIADFTGMHELEVQAIADGEVGANIQPSDPIADDLLTMEEIERCQGDEKASLKQSANDLPVKKQKGQRYKPIKVREEIPNAVVWLIRHYPDIKDSQIIKLIGTTKATITKLKEDQEYRNEKAGEPASPVELGLCSKNELDALTATL
ncbi:MAG: cell cycle transcriptional regulator TrcR [Alphaproteobacteria bacterium]